MFPTFRHRWKTTVPLPFWNETEWKISWCVCLTISNVQMPLQGSDKLQVPLILWLWAVSKPWSCSVFKCGIQGENSSVFQKASEKNPGNPLTLITWDIRKNCSPFHTKTIEKSTRPHANGDGKKVLVSIMQIFLCFSPVLFLCTFHAFWKVEYLLGYLDRPRHFVSSLYHKQPL